MQKDIIYHTWARARAGWGGEGGAGSAIAVSRGESVAPVEQHGEGGSHGQASGLGVAAAGGCGVSPTGHQGILRGG